MDRFSGMGDRSSAHPRSGVGKRRLAALAAGQAVFFPAPGARSPAVSVIRRGCRHPDRFCIVIPMNHPGDGKAVRVAPRPSALLFLFLLLLPVAAKAGDWRVSPIRLDLGRDTKSGAVTVANDSDDRLQVQMKAYEWTQDAE